MLSALRDRQVTYNEVGATADDVLPAGYQHVREAIAVGRGERAWNRSRAALRTWQGHRFAGMTITPIDALPDPGNTVMVATRIGPIVVLAPCRIVYATDAEDRFGFTYGTLPGHPEQGEEAFHVVRAADETVRFEIVAFSLPALALVKLAGPISRAAQTYATRKYLEGVRRYVMDGATK